MGLESTRQELNAMKENVKRLTSPQVAESGTITQQQEENKNQLKVAVVELNPKVEAENINENLQGNGT